MLTIDASLSPPAFADPRAALAAAMAELRFPEELTVSEAARRDRKLHNPNGYSGWWRDSPHDMRFTDRAMDALTSDSPYDEVVVEGPSQTAKSEVGNNWQLHTILYDPADMLFAMPDKESIRSYVTTQFTRMLDAQPKLRKRQLGGASSDNIALKQFRGCDFHFTYPTGPNFRAKPISRGRLDDFDDFPDDIADQGDAVSLLEGRMASFDGISRTKKYINSTPKKGSAGGIAALRTGGTDERWWVDCLNCGAPFELDTEKCLSFDRTGSPEQAAETAEVVCPVCGGCYRQAQKRELMGTGRWVGRGQHAVSREHDQSGVAGVLVASKRLSQRWDGLMGMRTWARIAQRWRIAELALENEQDDAPLKTFFQTVVGKNYTPQGQDEPPATEDDLKARTRKIAHLLGTVPVGGLVLIAAIDQHINRFEVAVWAFGAGFRAWLVDRFAVSVIMEGGRERPLRPFSRAEDWAVLHDRVLSRTYPIAGAPHLRMKIFNTAVDTGGGGNATDNAFAWWHSMVAGDVGSGRAPLPATALTLVKGGNRAEGQKEKSAKKEKADAIADENRRLLPPPTIDAKRQLKGAAQAEMFIPNVHRIKNITDVRLRRGDGGAGSIVFPADIVEGSVNASNPTGDLVAAPWIAEMRAETKEGGVWTRDSHKANETWDLYIYAYTVVIRFGGGDTTLSWVPEWARPPKGAPAPVVVEPTMRDVESGAAEAAADAAPVVQAGGGQRTVVQAQRPRRGVRVVRSR